MDHASSIQFSNGQSYLVISNGNRITGFFIKNYSVFSLLNDKFLKSMVKNKWLILETLCFGNITMNGVLFKQQLLEQN